MSLPVEILAKVIDIDSWELLLSQIDLWNFLDILPAPNPQEAAEFHLFPWHTRPLSCISPYLTLPLHSPPHLLSSSVPIIPLSPMTILFLFLSVIQTSFLGPSFLFNFLGLSGLSWIFCTFSLISTYQGVHTTHVILGLGISLSIHLPAKFMIFLSSFFNG